MGKKVLNRIFYPDQKEINKLTKGNSALKVNTQPGI